MLLIGKSYLFFWEEERRVKKHFYNDSLFRFCDRELKKSYRFCNPYRISKRFLMKRQAKDIHVYGETPISTWAHIVRECGINPQDNVVDLGCGRGRGVFFLTTVIGCQAHGIDWIPEFINQAIDIKEKFSLSRANFSCEDMCFSDLSAYSFVYLYGTCLDDLSLRHLTDIFFHLKKGTRLLTVSYPLESFSCIHTFSADYPWGKTNLYLHQVG
jgi:hypothetical protein